MASKAELDLGQLIAEVLQERGFLQDGEALGDYLVMAEVSNWTDEGQGKTKYVNIIPGEYGISMHRVRGLIEVCSDLLDGDDE